MKPKFNFKSFVVFENIVWTVRTIWTEPLPIKYTIERVYPEGQRMEQVDEKKLKEWDGKV